MRHLVSYSGGKDSTALLCWARDSLEDFTPVFCDTGWEHSQTYEYIDLINREFLGGRLLYLRSTEYPGGMRELVEKKGRVPSSRARFCTQELKILPLLAYRETLDDEVTIYQGIRAEESPNRALLDIEQFDNAMDAWFSRPLLHWTAKEVIAYLKHNRMPINPLYYAGASRVGCFPCVLVNHGDLARTGDMLPEMWERAAELERIAGRSFWYPKFIPARFHTGHDPKSGKSFPTVDDVRQYIESKSPTLWPKVTGQACMSVYNLCE